MQLYKHFGFIVCRNEDSPFSISESLLAGGGGLLQVGGPGILNFLISKIQDYIFTNHIDTQTQVIFFTFSFSYFFCFQNLSGSEVLVRQNAIFEEVQAIQSSEAIQ